jgi:hypothetical protein
MTIKQARGGARQGTGPKSGLGETPVKVTLLLGRDQAAFISQTRNKSGFVRALISDAMDKQNSGK